MEKVKRMPDWTSPTFELIFGAYLTVAWILAVRYMVWGTATLLDIDVNRRKKEHV